MIPSPSFWRHTVTIYRQTIGQDSSAGMTTSNLDAGEVCRASVHEKAQTRYPARSDENDAVSASSHFHVHLPADPLLFPTGPNIKTDDVIVWGPHKLSVLMDVDAMGRGGFQHIYTAYCNKII